MKILFDFLPIILFFVAYLIKGIWAATAVAIIASLLLFAWIYYQGKKPNLMQWFSVVVIVLFGGATLILDDPVYIQWKPSVLYILMGSSLLIARYGFKTNPLKTVLGEKVILPPHAWDKLSWMWVIFFVFMAGLNWFVLRNFSLDIWTYFKMFGTIILTFIFVIGQSFYLAPYMEEVSATENSPTSPLNKETKNDE
ncbi:MAG: septation protein A [Saezia sp.]